MVTLGSLQALLDLKVHLPWPIGVLLVLAFAACAVALEGLHPLPLAAFLAAQKTVLMLCLRAGLWGKCFSVAEAMFWAQGLALVCAALVRGCLDAFVDWHLAGILSS